MCKKYNTFKCPITAIHFAGYLSTENLKSILQPVEFIIFLHGIFFTVYILDLFIIPVMQSLISLIILIFTEDLDESTALHKWSSLELLPNDTESHSHLQENHDSGKV